MIVDHDAAVDLLDFDCEEDPLRFEMEVWVVWEEESNERDNWESHSSCSGSSDCEKAEDC